MTIELERGCGEPWTCERCEAVNDDIRQKCRICKTRREEVSHRHDFRTR